MLIETKLYQLQFVLIQSYPASIFVCVNCNCEKNVKNPKDVKHKTQYLNKSNVCTTQRAWWVSRPHTYFDLVYYLLKTKRGNPVHYFHAHFLEHVLTGNN